MKIEVNDRSVKIYTITLAEMSESDVTALRHFLLNCHGSGILPEPLVGIIETMNDLSSTPKMKRKRRYYKEVNYEELMDAPSASVIRQMTFDELQGVARVHNLLMPRTASLAELRAHVERELHCNDEDYFSEDGD